LREFSFKALFLLVIILVGKLKLRSKNCISLMRINIDNFQLERSVARLISLLFHPMLVTFYGIVLLYQLDLYNYFPHEFHKWISTELEKWTYMVVAINTILIPLSLIPFYLYRKLILSVRMEQSHERIIPLIIQSILFLITYYILHRFYAPVLITGSILVGTISVFIALLISWYWKISLHLLGIGALTGIFFILSVKYRIDLNNYLIFLFIASGLIGYSRLKLDAHNQNQIYAGFAVGFSISSGVFYFL